MERQEPTISPRNALLPCPAWSSPARGQPSSSQLSQHGASRGRVQIGTERTYLSMIRGRRLPFVDILNDVRQSSDQARGLEDSRTDEASSAVYMLCDVRQISGHARRNYVGSPPRGGGGAFCLPPSAMCHKVLTTLDKIMWEAWKGRREGEVGCLPLVRCLTKL